MENDIREPKQKRSIEKKEKIIKSGWDLIIENGYYKTNTAEIANKANVSTGIVYQYFKDKHDILISGIYKYGDEIFYPILDIENLKFSKYEFPNIVKNMIDNYIKDHKISSQAHEEIMSMVHSDEKIAEYYYKREMDMTDKIYNALIKNNINSDNLKEKVHIMIGMIDNICHEVVYHKHENMNYDIMIDLVIDSIINLITK